MSVDREFDGVEEIVRASALFRLATAVIVAIARAADDSALATRARSVRDRFRSLSPVNRLRMTGVAVATAAIGHLLLLATIPAIVAPAMPKVFWFLLAALGVCAAVVPADRTGPPTSAIR